MANLLIIITEENKLLKSYPTTVLLCWLYVLCSWKTNGLPTSQRIPCQHTMIWMAQVKVRTQAVLAWF